MLTNAIKMYLIALGMHDVENWTKEQLLDHIDRVLMKVQKEEPEELEHVINDMMAQIISHVHMLRKVLEQ
ncbi:hypothetical protein D3C76_613250 [compost metagenome]